MNDLGTSKSSSGGAAAPGDSRFSGDAIDRSMLVRILDLADTIQERVSQALARIELSYPKYEVLKHLQEAGEAITLGALAEGQSCARSNITQLIDRLEADGLVRRVADPDDRRSVRAELTTLGEARALQGKVEMEKVVTELEGSFSDPERVQLARLLAKLG
jgi:DNA-binding MarR family transcriptional regulator